MNVLYLVDTGSLLGRWHPGIGDPSFIGWFATGSYLCCSLVAFRAACLRRSRGRESFFWATTAVILLMLGINKQLDLQQLLTEIGRPMAYRQGWIEHRRIVQFWFVFCFGGIVAAALSWLAFFVKDLPGRFITASIGLVVLAFFVMVRAAGFHHVDRVPGFRLLFTLAPFLELAGIYVIFVAIFLDLLGTKASGNGTGPV